MFGELDNIIKEVQSELPDKQKREVEYELMNGDPDYLETVPEGVAYDAHVMQISEHMKWKKAFSYLWTGTPNAGKSTFVLYMALLMSFYDEWKWCVWTPEMEDAYKKGKSVKHHIKDLIDLLAWTITGKCPFEWKAKKLNLPFLDGKERRDAYQFINEHFKFIHAYNRTPGGLINAFGDIYDKHDVDGFILDPWKSVKQIITSRSDVWLEDVLMSFKEFSLLTNTVMNFVVHPKTLKDYKGEDGQYRVITPFDLNGGAAWNNSMDVIISIRRILSEDFDEGRMELYFSKIRKQHLLGYTGRYEDVFFRAKSDYRYVFSRDKYDPIAKKYTGFTHIR